MNSTTKNRFDSVRMAFVALALFLSIGGAFASKLLHGNAKFNNTYYVVGEKETGSQQFYILSDNSPAPTVCNTPMDNFPCEISSATTLPTEVLKSDIESNPNVDIQSWRSSLD